MVTERRRKMNKMIKFIYLLVYFIRGQFRLNQVLVFENQILVLIELK